MFFAIIFFITEYKYFMKVQILIDNRPDLSERLHFEHGLSIYTEFCGKRILVDTGLSGRAMLNAEILGIDIGKVDYLILSHGHKDHTGGLGSFVDLNKNALIIACSKIAECDYTSDSRGYRHSLNPDKILIDSVMSRMVMLEDDIWCLEEDGRRMVVERCFSSNPNKPNGNRLLHIDGMPYAGQDELVVSMAENNKLTVISPCSHNGMGNIAGCAAKRHGMDVCTYVGGLHYVDGENDMAGAGYLPLVEPQIKKIYTGHCTGKIAGERLRAMAGDRVEFFRTGDVIYC